MERVRLCVGNYAETPYYFENLGVRVFSAEELCYVIRENAFLLDRELVDKKLVKWIDESLCLPQLAAALYPMLRGRTSVGSFAVTILEYVKFYDADTIRQTEEIFKTGANLNAYEKLKSRVDYMMENGKYAPALTEYDALLEMLPEGEKELTAKLHHNKGVALCGLFLFKQAVGCFWKSYELIPSQETLIAYLGAQRLSMEEDEYIAFVASCPEYYEETLELERRVQSLHAQFQDSEEKKYLELLEGWKEQGEVARYYGEAERRVQALKELYRASVTG